jgi:hypothetical protein
LLFAGDAPIEKKNKKLLQAKAGGREPAFFIFLTQLVQFFLRYEMLASGEQAHWLRIA